MYYLLTVHLKSGQSIKLICSSYKFTVVDGVIKGYEFEVAGNRCFFDIDSIAAYEVLAVDEDKEMCDRFTCKKASQFLEENFSIMKIKAGE